MKTDSPPTTTKAGLIGLAGWLVLAFLTAAVGAVASANAGSFYNELVRPTWGPPAWLFGPVWSVLYLFMGISAWLVWREHGFDRARVALGLFVIQLVANALWSWLFFFWKQGGWAFIDILILWLLVAATIIQFWRQPARIAAILLIPYLAWITFAAFLNLSVWQLNPAILG
jgi:tryptophan-rich sensory protein